MTKHLLPHNLLSALDLVKRNTFYTKLKAILTRQRGLYTEQGKRLRYQGQPLVDRKNLKKYQWLTQVAAHIRRDLEAARQALNNDREERNKPIEKAT